MAAGGCGVEFAVVGFTAEGCGDSAVAVGVRAGTVVCAGALGVGVGDPPPTAVLAGAVLTNAVLPATCVGALVTGVPFGVTVGVIPGVGLAGFVRLTVDASSAAFFSSAPTVVPPS